MEPGARTRRSSIRSGGSRKHSIASSTGLSSTQQPLSIDANLTAKQLLQLLRTTSSFYGSQFAFRSRLPPVKQLLDNLLLQHPKLDDTRVAFVLDLTQSIDKESRLIDLLLNAIPGLRQNDRDIDSIIIYLLVYRLEAFAFANVNALARIYPVKMSNILQYLLADLSKQGELFHLLFRWHDLRFIDRRIMAPLRNMKQELAVVLGNAQKSKLAKTLQ